MKSEPTSNPEDETLDRVRRIVVDADVLAADVFLDGAARAAMDRLRSHDWLQVVASEALIGDAAAVIRALGDADLAADWRALFGGLVAETVEHPAGDHPALASAYRGGAGHLLTLDEELRAARTGAGLQPHMDLSVRSPDAFVRVVDPAVLYETLTGEAYPGPDRDPRAARVGATDRGRTRDDPD